MGELVRPRQNIHEEMKPRRCPANLAGRTFRLRMGRGFRREPALNARSPMPDGCGRDSIRRRSIRIHGEVAA